MNLACSGDKSFPDRCVSSTDLREASEERPLKVCGKRGTLEESEPRALGFSNTAICVIMRTSILSRLGRFVRTLLTAVTACTIEYLLLGYLPTSVISLFDVEGVDTAERSAKYLSWICKTTC